MPYKLRKAPGVAKYWVVGEDGKHHSKEPMPKEDAKKQLRALYAAHGRKMEREAYTGGRALETAPPVSAVELLEMCKQTYVYVKTGNDPTVQIGEFHLVESTPLCLLYRYKSDDAYILAVRGTAEFRDKLAWIPVTQDTVKKTSVFKDLVFTVKKWKKTHPGNWYGTGHSLGGALCDNLVERGFILEAVTFNPAIEPRFVGWTSAGHPLNHRIYFEGDPLYNIFGRGDPNAVLVSDPSPSWFEWLTTGSVSSHGLENFEGKLNDSMLGAGKTEPDVEAIFAVLEGKGFVPKELYTTAENQTSTGNPRPQHQRRGLRDIELGLRAIAHLDEQTNPLGAFAARVMADDLYEYRTGDHVDYGHDKAEIESFKRAFRETRPLQEERLGEVNALMAKHNVDREVAYEYATGVRKPPAAPKAVALVKSASQVRREMEEAERLSREARESEEKRKGEEEEKAARKAEAKAKADRLAAEQLQAKVEAQQIEEEKRRLEAEQKDAERRDAERKEAEEAALQARIVAERAEAMAAVEKARAKVAGAKDKKKKKEAEEEQAFAEAEMANAILENLPVLQNSINIRKEDIAYYRKRLSATLREMETLKNMTYAAMDPDSGRTITEADIRGVLEKGRGLSRDLDAGERVALEEALREIEKTKLKGLTAMMKLAGDQTYLESQLAKQIEALANLEKQVEETKREAGQVGKKKGKGKHSGLAQALGHIGVVKKELEEYRQLRETHPKKEVRKEANKIVQEAKKELDKRIRRVNIFLETGKGRQHKAFPYSRSDLTAEEKAKERSAHYREVARGVRSGAVKARKAKEGEEGDITINKGKVVITDVPAELKEKVSARGRKEKMPKKDSVRKPYVGKKMKEAFLAKSQDTKLLKRAKRLYKEGGKSWEEVMRQVLGQ